jgi:hypothetical protein
VPARFSGQSGKYSWSNSTHHRPCPPIVVIVVEFPIQIQPTTRSAMAFISKCVSSTSGCRLDREPRFCRRGIEAAQKQSEDDGVLTSAVGASRHRQMFLQVSGKASLEHGRILCQCGTTTCLYLTCEKYCLSRQHAFSISSRY